MHEIWDMVDASIEDEISNDSASEGSSCELTPRHI